MPRITSWPFYCDECHAQGWGTVTKVGTMRQFTLHAGWTSRPVGPSSATLPHHGEAVACSERCDAKLKRREQRQCKREP
jgi:hypothetical protein